MDFLTWIPIFSREKFHEIIGYVWLGGYPQWKAGIRPDYVMQMKEEIESSENWLFQGAVFTE